MTWQILEGDCRAMLAGLPAGSVHTCVTSPPYFGLRNYGNDQQIGLEPTPDEFVAALVGVFREVRRVLRNDGTVWLVIGDSYAAGGATRSLGRNDAGRNLTGGGGNHEGSGNPGRQGAHASTDGCKPKDLIGIPWMVAFALRADGWYLRSEIIWAKKNCMPESVTDRPTKSHEQLFLLSKSPHYFYDADAIREPSDHPNLVGKLQKVSYHDESAMRQDGDRIVERTANRNKRSVWTVATQPFTARGLGGGKTYTASPDCPVHGLAACPERWRMAADGGPQDHYSYRIDSSDARRALEHRAEASSSSCRSPVQPPSVAPSIAPARTSESTLASRTQDPSTGAVVAGSSRDPSRTMSTGESSATTAGNSGSPVLVDALPATASSTESRKSAAPSTLGDSDDAGLLFRTQYTGPTDARPALGGSGSRAKSGIPADTARMCACAEDTVDHFATFPPKLIEPCILAGCPEGGTVLDPFAGAGTTGMVALRHNRSFVGVELNPAYAELARCRICDDSPLFNWASEVA